MRVVRMWPMVVRVVLVRVVDVRAMMMGSMSMRVVGVWPVAVTVLETAPVYVRVVVDRAPGHNPSYFQQLAPLMTPFHVV